MYHKILDEAIQELKEDEFAELFKEERMHKLESKDCTIETDFEALIPDEYVRSVSERVSLYGELSRLETDEQIDDFGTQLVDRFGALPQQVLDLFELIKLRTVAKKIGFEKLIIKNASMAAYFPDEKKQAFYQSEQFSKILTFVQQNSQRCKLKQTPKSLILGIQHVSGIGHAKGVLDDLWRSVGE
jgi:transcription-repair coupling factor (superfamily II helicase)